MVGSLRQAIDFEGFDAAGEVWRQEHEIEAVRLRREAVLVDADSRCMGNVGVRNRPGIEQARNAIVEGCCQARMAGILRIQVEIAREDRGCGAGLSLEWPPLFTGL